MQNKFFTGIKNFIFSLSYYYQILQKTILIQKVFNKMNIYFQKKIIILLFDINVLFYFKNGFLIFFMN